MKISCAHDHHKSFEELCTEALRSSGSRITKSRLAVINCLAKSNTPLTPKEIFNEIQLDNSTSNIDQVSVYRILETLHTMNLIHRISTNGGFISCTHLDCKAPLHVLTHCTHCKKTNETEIPSEILSPLKWYIEGELAFEPSQHIVQIDGICAKCSKKL